MMIPIPLNARGLVLTSLIGLVTGVFVIVNNSKDKAEYDKATGVIEYYSKEFQDLPIRYKGDFRYLKVDTYPYIFEIFEPNSQPTVKKIDDLKVGDKIDIYYYEIEDTRKGGINRFTQFIDKDGQPYFVRNGFQKQFGFVLIGLCLLIDIVTFVLVKKGKLQW